MLGDVVSERADDAAAIHEAVFTDDRVAKLTASVEDVAACIAELYGACKASRPRIDVGLAERVEAPFGWTPYLDSVTPSDRLVHPSGTWFSAVLPGDHPTAAVWTVATGAIDVAPPGATHIAFSSDGDEAFVVFDTRLERWRWPSLRRVASYPLGGFDGYARHVSLSPSGRFLAVLTARGRGKPGGTMRLIELDDEADEEQEAQSRHAADHENHPNAVVFNADESVFAYSALDPAWFAEEDEARAKRHQMSYGFMALGLTSSTSGAGGYNLLAFAPDEPGAGREQTRLVPPTFSADLHVEQALPGGRTFRGSYAWVLPKPKVVAQPKKFSEAVRHRVRPRRRTPAEQAIAAAPWAPQEPFAAAWIREGEEALLATRQSLSRVRVADGFVLGLGAAWFFGGWPTEVVVRQDGLAAAIAWSRPASFDCGFELVDLRGAEPTQRLGAGAGYGLFPKQAQPMLTGPICFGPGDLVAAAIGLGAYWYLPDEDRVFTGTRPMCGHVEVRHLETGGHRRMMFHPTTLLSETHIERDDPDRPGALRWTSAEQLEVETSNGDVVPLTLPELKPRAPQDGRYRYGFPQLAPLEGGPERASVVVNGRGRLHGSFAVPAGGPTVTASRFEPHPNGEYVILRFAEAREGGALAAVFDTKTGECVFEREGALAMAWVVDTTRGFGGTGDLAVLMPDEIAYLTLPSRQLSRTRLRPPEIPAFIGVFAAGDLTVVVWSDPTVARAGYSVFALRGKHAVARGETSVATQGIVDFAFGPDGTVWAGFAPAISALAPDPRIFGELLVFDRNVSGATHRFSVELDDAERSIVGEDAEVTVDFASESEIVVRIPGVRARSFVVP